MYLIFICFLFITRAIASILLLRTHTAEASIETQLYYVNIRVNSAAAQRSNQAVESYCLRYCIESAALDNVSHILVIFFQIVPKK